MNEVAVDVQQGRAVRAHLDRVSRPDLVEQRRGSAMHGLFRRYSAASDRFDRGRRGVPNRSLTASHSLGADAAEGVPHRHAACRERDGWPHAFSSASIASQTPMTALNSSPGTMASL